MAAFFDNGSMERGMVMQTYHGKSVFGGVAVGKICVYQKGEQTVKRTKIERERAARKEYRMSKRQKADLNELFILDIMREEMENDDPRLF